MRNSSIVPVVGYLYLFGSSCGRCLKDLLAKVRSAMESGLQELVYVFHAWKQHPHELYTPHEKVA